MVTMCQILGGLPRALALQLPDSFRKFLWYLAVISQFVRRPTTPLGISIR